MPRDSSSPVSASMTGIPGLRMHPSPRTAPGPTRAPWVIMQRLPMRASSSTITGAACGRLEHAADADPARQVDVGADLGARTHRRPGVDHGVGADPGADVDVARHHDDARLEEAAPAGRGARAPPGRPPRRSRASAGACRRTRTGPPRRSPWPRAGRAAGWPASATRGRRPRPPVDLGDPGLAAVEQVDRLVDVGGGLGVAGLQLGPALPQSVMVASRSAMGRR